MSATSASPSAVIARLTLLLPERRRLPDAELAPALAAALARAERWPTPAHQGLIQSGVLQNGMLRSGELAQLQRYFTLQPQTMLPGWPMAALARQRNCGDAGEFQWLHADFAHVRPDLAGARLLACGNLPMSSEAAMALFHALQPLFDGDLELLANTAGRWLVRVPKDRVLPQFSDPEHALGDDLLGHLPQGPDAECWRRLLNEVQMVLHQHPVNAARVVAGQLPVNSLWFWGAGCLPERIAGAAAIVETDAEDLQALAAAAEAGADGYILRDLRDARQWLPLQRDHLLPAVHALRSGALRRVDLDFADGAGYTLRPSQRWRLWRRPLTALS